jgi:hypothetical protein
MTAIRETFEETGLLLASPATSDPEVSPPPSEAALDASRKSIHTGRTLFRDFLRQHALSADVEALLPFTEWITPLGIPRCVASSLTPHSLTHTHATNPLTTAQRNTAASTRVSTSLSCPPSARQASHPPPLAQHRHSIAYPRPRPTADMKAKKSSRRGSCTP